MTRIIIRCDASMLVGSGHVMRCLTLARHLKSRGSEVFFICRRQPGDLIGMLETEFSVLTLPEQSLVDVEGLKGRQLYQAWLGCTQDQDAIESLQALATAGITRFEWLVVDHYGLDHNWEHHLLASSHFADSPKVLVVDDLADRPHFADLLLDQNFFGDHTHHRYNSLLPSNCRQLLGPHYALISPEYAYLHPAMPVRKELRRVLIFFGGVDNANCTTLALDALSDLKFQHVAVDVVLGLRCPHHNQVEALVNKRPNTKLHHHLPSLAGLIARADLAIGAGGATTWERICLGLPSIVIAASENQLPFSQVLDEFGYINLLGLASQVTALDIYQAVLGSFDDTGIFMTRPKLTDGFGTSRLVTAMLGLEGNLHLKRVTKSDQDLLLRWANDPIVRSNSLSSDFISFAAHESWFKAGLSDPDRLHWIATDNRGCPVGQIRLDSQPNEHSVVLSLSLDTAARGLGLSSIMVNRAITSMQFHWRSACTLIANVLSSNKASQALFSALGFVIDEPASSAKITRWRMVFDSNSRVFPGSNAQ